jgi:selenide,water dikinase
MYLATKPGVHALTDVTGFGLLGHLLEVCRGSGVRARLQWSAVPLLTEARTLASTGFVTGGSARNWKSYGTLVDLTTHGAVEQAILTDPQTSGGLLVACAPEVVDDVMDCFQREGFQRAAVIGEIEEGSPAVTVV